MSLSTPTTFSEHREEYEIDGRKIRIEWKVQPEDKEKERIRVLILRVCVQDAMAKIFPLLEFHIETKIRPHIILEEVTNGKNVLHLSLEQDTLMSSKKVPITRSQIIHELTHLWHTAISTMPTASLHKRARLNKALDFTRAAQEKSFEAMRLFLSDVMDGLVLEGIAKYNEEFIRGTLIFNWQTFEEYYQYTKERVVSLKNTLYTYYAQLVRNDPRIDREMEFFFLMMSKDNFIYPVGLHLTYSILFLNNKVSFQDLARMSIVKFVKTYEKAMLSINKTPVISYTSAAGIFDYKKELKKLRTAKKVAEKYR